MDLATFLSILTALGAGSVIGTWYGAGQTRREVRSAILKAIAMTEKERWAEDPDSADYPEFVTAVRDLETAALIARIPRRSVRHYVVLAEAARGLSDASVYFDPADQSFFGGIDGYFDTLVRDTAELLARLAWSPWISRVTLLRDLSNLRRRAMEFDDSRIRHKLAGAQKRHGRLPGSLGELPGIEDPPQFVERQEKQEK